MNSINNKPISSFVGVTAKPPARTGEPSNEVSTDAAATYTPSAPSATQETQPAAVTSTPPPVEAQPGSTPPEPQALRSIGHGQLGEGLYMTGSGSILTEDPSMTAYIKEAGAPTLISPVASTLLRGSNTSAISAAVTTATPAGAAALGLMMQHFSPTEFLALNPGFYHSPAHPLNVAGVAGDLAKGMGRSEADVKFMQQVALLHDADERVNLRSGDHKPGTPASVGRTLHFMDLNKDGLKQRMGWSDGQFVKAKALIARTDFPFDDKPRTTGTAYDGKSPQTVYKDLLNEIPASERAQVMEDGVALSYADQIGNYTGTIEQADATVAGLAREIKLDPQIMAKGTYGFMAAVGQETATDTWIAQELGVQGANFPAREALEAALPADVLSQYRSNLEHFRSLSGK